MKFTEPSEMGPIGGQRAVHAAWDAEARIQLDEVAAALAPLTGSAPVNRGRFPPQKEAASVTRIGDMASTVIIGEAVQLILSRVNDMQTQLDASQTAAKKGSK